MTRFLTLRTMSVTSSITPFIELNSWFTPAILTDVTALPSRDERRTRLRLLPIVVPNPRSKGSMKNLPYILLDTLMSRSTRVGSSKPRHVTRIYASGPKISIFKQLSRTELDHQLLFYGNLDVFPRRQGHNGCFGLFSRQLQPALRGETRIGFQLLLDLLFAFLSAFDDNLVTDFHDTITNINFASVDVDMSVRNKLASGLPRRSKVQLVNDIVQPSLQQLEQILPGISLYAFGLVEVPHELSLEKAVIPFDFLLFSQPNSVFAVPSSAPAVHAWGDIALLLLNGALRHLASDTLEHQLHTFPAA